MGIGTCSDFLGCPPDHLTVLSDHVAQPDVRHRQFVPKGNSLPHGDKEGPLSHSDARFLALSELPERRRHIVGLGQHDRIDAASCLHVLLLHCPARLQDSEKGVIAQAAPKDPNARRRHPS